MKVLAGLAGLLVLAPTAALAASPGLLDKSFGVHGTATLTPAPQHGVQCCFVLVDGKGRILLTGNDVTSGSSRVFVERLLPDGSPDPAYGTGGRVLLPAVQGAASLVLTRPQLLPGGGLQVLSQARATLDAPSRNVLTRLRADGSADPSFGVGGRTVSAAVYSSGFISVSAVAGDGATTVVSADRSGSWSRQRYAADGSLQPGRASVDLQGANQVVWYVAVDARGRTTVLGDVTAGDCTPPQPVVLRQLADGSADPSFGSGGRQRYVTTQAPDFFDLVPLPDGGYLLADGASYAGRQIRAVLARTDSTGRLLASFGDKGYASFGAAAGFGNTVRAGTVTQAVWDPTGGSAVFRLDLATGKVVRSFGDQGRIPLSLTVASMDDTGSIAADGQGGVVVAAGAGTGPRGYYGRGLVRRWLPNPESPQASTPTTPTIPDGLRRPLAQRTAC